MAQSLSSHKPMVRLAALTHSIVYAGLGDTILAVGVELTPLANQVLDTEYFLDCLFRPHHSSGAGKDDPARKGRV